MSEIRDARFDDLDHLIARERVTAHAGHQHPAQFCAATPGMRPELRRARYLKETARYGELAEHLERCFLHARNNGDTELMRAVTEIRSAVRFPGTPRLKTQETKS